jgi:hypothetical protein
MLCSIDWGFEQNWKQYYEQKIPDFVISIYLLTTKEEIYDASKP